MKTKTRGLPSFKRAIAPALLAGAAVSVVRSLLRRRRSEADLRRRADELSRANAELQSFASMASHELQEPMRKIVAFGDLLRRHAAGTLPEEGRQDLDRIQGAAKRLVTLTDALLRYSRVGVRSLRLEAVPLSGVLDEALVDVNAAVSGAKAEVRREALPVVRGDETQLRLLVSVLLSNALKYHEPGARPEISISALDRGDRWELRFADNGIGFDASYAERIFEPFTRLHPRSKYEGTGMGLATARRVAERHGGRLTAETRPEGGSIFVLWLPKLQGGPA
ncbi:MAG: hypothetical protein HY925_02930 [Elusimicrobia bacterium]|nr:hypothetical protein [Elusimicrobiota bacterium]